MLEWNVYVSDFNAKNIKTHNLFNHGGLVEDLKKNLKKNKDDREAFEAQLRRDLMYWYWSKCEWEIILSHWPPRNCADDLKIDVFDQVWLNKQRFLDYVWENRQELMSKRRTRKKENQE